MRFTCLRCGHRWDSRVENPKACPACKSYKWETEATEKVKREPIKKEEN